MRMALRRLSAALLKINRPKHVVFPLLPRLLGAWAVTLYPYILYRNKELKDDECIREHELYHWRQIRRLVVLCAPVAPIAPILALLLWYVAYIIIWAVQPIVWKAVYKRSMRADEHLLEREAYRVQWDCQTRK